MSLHDLLLNIVQGSSDRAQRGCPMIPTSQNLMKNCQWIQNVYGISSQNIPQHPKTHVFHQQKSSFTEENNYTKTYQKQSKLTMISTILHPSTIPTSFPWLMAQVPILFPWHFCSIGPQAWPAWLRRSVDVWHPDVHSQFMAIIGKTIFSEIKCCSAMMFKSRRCSPIVFGFLKAVRLFNQHFQTAVVTCDRCPRDDVQSHQMSTSKLSVIAMS